MKRRPRSSGIKHVLGICVQAVEGAKFWAGVCAQLANRGIEDVLFVCCDGLTGFPEAIEATWPLLTLLLINHGHQCLDFQSGAPPLTQTI